MNNYENRIKKVEEIVQNFDDDNSPCIAFTFPNDRGLSKKEIMREIIGIIGITAKEFAKWKKHEHDTGEWLIFSPNFTIEKCMRQIQTEKGNED